MVRKVNYTCQASFPLETDGRSHLMNPWPVLLEAYTFLWWSVFADFHIFIKLSAQEHTVKSTCTLPSEQDYDKAKKEGERGKRNRNNNSCETMKG